MAEAPFTPERRVSGLDRRLISGRGGRRVGDDGTLETMSAIRCPACGLAWALIRSFGFRQGQATATYICPRCGHHEKRVGVV
jgi:predicted RNA-binding Zn-ribbon protein involved in translation (DUF1610 family)